MTKLINSLAIAGLALGTGALTASASSHREAPAIAEDQYVDNTDVYAFISPNNANNLVIVADYVPLLLPASGPNFYKFSDSARYEVHIDNDGDAVADLTYRWTFDSQRKNGATFLYNTNVIESITSQNLNVTQTYKLERVNEHNGQITTIMDNVPVAPWNVGKRSFPNNSYEQVALQAVRTAKGVTAFAGPRDEPFFVDLHVFDLLGVGGAKTTDGVNVMSLVLELPITDIANKGARPAASATGPTSVVGIYASASRPRTRFLRGGRNWDHYGGFVQVSRLAWPLINEVIIPLQDKDKYNRSSPKNDVANFGAYILFPEVNGLLSGVLKLNCKATPSTGRTDITDLLSPAGTKTADLLRIKINQGETFANSKFPNGRALVDDVTDTLLTVACNNGTTISDGVGPDTNFTTTFPYLASPISGNP
jgi:hypothetical protein